MTDSGKRFLGSYFRVAFFGDRFEPELRSRQFVYKQPALTNLAEFSLNLQAFYKNLLGDSVVELITDSKAVDVAALDRNKAYVQVTFVQPHFADNELKRRVTYFERNTGLKQFVCVGRARQDATAPHLPLTLFPPFPGSRRRSRWVRKRTARSRSSA